MELPKEFYEELENWRKWKDIWGKKKRIPKTGDPPNPSLTSDYSITVNDFEWPNLEIAPRVNYGDQISKFKLLIKSLCFFFLFCSGLIRKK